MSTARRAVRSCAIAMAALFATFHFGSASATSVSQGSSRYAPTVYPDRIVVLPNADPATSLTVAWRTDARVDRPRLQITRAKDSPDLADDARELIAQTQALATTSGIAHHHHVRADGLQPDTLYAYRVQGSGTWSEWFQLRTAAREARPFSFLYFGDAQNSIKSLYSRVIREAWRREPEAALMIHAGDLISGRDDKDDDEWGEWFDAGQFLHATSFVVPAAGNHEHDEDPRNSERYILKRSWSAHFPAPRNGSEQLATTTYSFDYQGVRFIVLDSTAAVANGLGKAQAAWLEPLLRDNPNRWTVVTYHHPMYSAALDRDNPQLRKQWRGLFERYGVDLVLQGHDHVYGRGPNLPEGTNNVPASGPIYVVSVAGPKQYRVSAEARRTLQRTAENTQLYQIVHVSAGELRYESRTATGALYDAFTLTKDSAGRKRIQSGESALGEARRCPHAQSRSGRRDRCWDGNEW